MENQEKSLENVLEPTATNQPSVKDNLATEEFLFTLKSGARLLLEFLTEGEGAVENIHNDFVKFFIDANSDKYCVADSDHVIVLQGLVEISLDGHFMLQNEEWNRKEAALEAAYNEIVASIKRNRDITQNEAKLFGRENMSDYLIDRHGKFIVYTSLLYNNAFLGYLLEAAKSDNVSYKDVRSNIEEVVGILCDIEDNIQSSNIIDRKKWYDVLKNNLEAFRKTIKDIPCNSKEKNAKLFDKDRTLILELILNAADIKFGKKKTMYAFMSELLNIDEEVIKKNSQSFRKADFGRKPQSNMAGKIKLIEESFRDASRDGLFFSREVNGLISDIQNEKEECRSR